MTRYPLERTCCYWSDLERCGVTATVVCRCVDGLEWFACDVHRDQPIMPGDLPPTMSTPIDEWFSKWVAQEETSHDHG
jgi:hypothetical protein